MKFKLDITNFFAIGEASLDLTDKGLVLVQGQNKDESSADSNGSGKSTIPDALCWCLHGLTARGETGDAVINRKAKKGTRVATHIIDGADEYEIARHRKHKIHKNKLIAFKIIEGGDNIDLTKGTDKETQLVVDRIIGCSYDVFRAAVYAGQEDMPDLPGMTDKVLKTLIEQAAGIEVLERAYEIARKLHLATTANVDTLTADAERIVDKIGMVQIEIDGIHVSIKEWSDGHAKKISANKTNAVGLIETVKELRGEITDKAEVEAALAEIEASLEGVEGEKDSRSKLEIAVRDAEKVGERAKASDENAKARVVATTRAIETAEARVGEPCDECGKKYVASDIAGAKEILENRLVAEKRDADTGRATLEDASQSSVEAHTALSEFISSMTDVSDTVATQRDLTSTLRQIVDAEHDIASKTEQAKRMVEENKRLVEEKNPHASNLVTAKDRWEILNDSGVTCDKDIAVAEEKALIAKQAVDVYGPAGVRAHILDTVTPYLNDRTAHYLSNLSDGHMQATWNTITTTKSGELREKFQIEVSNDTGGDRFGTLSGGEKRKARLSCALALQDLVASRATKPIDLWMGDEIDDALDGSGLERLMNVLDEKARERGTVLVISHNDLADWCREVATVIKSGGSAVVEGSLSK